MITCESIWLKQAEDELVKKDAEIASLKSKLDAYMYPSKHLVEWFCDFFKENERPSSICGHDYCWISDLKSIQFEKLLECWKFGLVKFYDNRQYLLTSKGFDLIDSEKSKNDADSYCHY
jgi:hypothetical protein